MLPFVRFLAFQCGGFDVESEIVSGLDSEERALLVAALVALRHERGRDWREACRIADDRGDMEPRLDAYGIEQIKRLARRLGGEARHWMD
jgi:hypothetical protein